MSHAKKQELPSGLPPGSGLWPGLWVVATPIGNLSDLSPRARAALECASQIFCEDTRHAIKLLSALGIRADPSRLIRLDAHTEARELEGAVETILEAESNGLGCALVTDAGTPAISDPGARLVALAHSRGVRVVPIPGPSALAAFLSVAGFEGTAFAFRGFFPRNAKERKEELLLCANSAAARTYVWFESPHRIQEALEAVENYENTLPVVVAKELTKIHERIFCGEVASVSQEIRAHLANEGALGEWIFAIHFMKDVEAGSGNAWEKALQCLLDAQVSASVAAKQVSQHFGEPRNRVYEKALALSGKK